MPLNVGDRLGHYDVTALIGEGGMGQVWQATDTQLHRDVALKILPDAFAADPDRLARFQREAHVLASLNHPGIAAIYGIERSDDTQALVLELVEGPTLADRIKHGPIPVDEALPIAKQIAEALEAAHEAGVIHRDLKPANIKVREDGTVKVLDFGLAKALEPESSQADASQSPTLTAGATDKGLILGTAAYMSPEQARAVAVDRRADIWAFGCILYEILTGTSAFLSPTISDTVAKVIEREPDHGRVPVSTPASITRLVRRCLEKDRKRRLQHIGDARIEIEEAASGPTVADGGPTDGRQQDRRLLVSAAAALLVAGSIIGALMVWRLSAEPRTTASVKRFVIELPPTDSFITRSFARPGSVVALSPDGETLVYAARRRGVDFLARRLMNQLQTSDLPGTEDARSPFFSPDGQWIGYYRADRSLHRVPVAGGPPVAVTTTPGTVHGASWGLDDIIIFGVHGSGLWRVPATGGAPEQLTTPDESLDEVSHVWPEILPGGRTVLFAAWSGSLETSQVSVLSLDTRERRPLVQGTRPRFVPSTSHIVFAREDSLWAVPFDPDQLEVVGSPAPVLQGVRFNPDGSADFTIGGDGALVFLPATLVGLGTLVWVDRDGQASPALDEPNAYQWPRLAADGRRVAVSVPSAGGNSDVWVYDVSRRTRTRLTTAGNNMTPVWTPDGTRVVFSSTVTGSGDLYWKAADGGGEMELLAGGDHPQYPTGWTPDGRELLYYEINPVTGRDVWAVELEHETSPLLATAFDERSAVLSPDGRWMAYVSTQSGQPEVYVQAFPNSSERWTISTDGGTEPVWGQDGRELFYRSRDRLMAVAVETDPDFSPQPARALFDDRYLPNPSGLNSYYDVAPDGPRFLMIEPSLDSPPTQLHVVLNWHQELLERVPVP